MGPLCFFCLFVFFLLLICHWQIRSLFEFIWLTKCLPYINVVRKCDVNSLMSFYMILSRD